jgi:hypothetical protein
MCEGVCALHHMSRGGASGRLTVEADDVVEALAQPFPQPGAYAPIGAGGEHHIAFGIHDDCLSGQRLPSFFNQYSSQTGCVAVARLMIGDEPRLVCTLAYTARSASVPLSLCVSYGLATPESLHMHGFLEQVLPGSKWLT